MMVDEVSSSLFQKILLIWASLGFVGVIATLLNSRSVLHWSVWKHLCLDTFVVIALPVFTGALSTQLIDIYEFCIYEALDLRYELEQSPREDQAIAWEGIRYYDHVSSVDERYIFMAFNPFETEEVREVEGTSGEEDE